ncbi:type I-F CRISPR-associated protein Csy2 [Succinimonas amylolytica]|uniref:type I-F CRISPR-associated protein Csy2 n=1 Tax=Succinimonas amylolytica TaxID=83769 RepID=UPI0003715A8F|nr:type I-F CRISPR-associated protein Csy2 [Succinimonas amylolytica]
MSIKTFLILPHIKVNNANAWSSPYTAGFPSVCAFGGAVHALQRKFNEKGFNNFEINGLGIINHKFSMRTYREGQYSDLSIIAGANPLDKDGNRPSFVPEIKCILEVSLLCELAGITNDDEDEDIEHTANDLLNSGFRIASGDVQPTETPYITRVNTTNEEDENFRKDIIHRLMPGYALIERRELMIESMKLGNDALDALIEHISVIAEPHINNGKVDIERYRKNRGWLVPISTGYAAINELGRATNQRDPETPHCFAEAIVTLGEFKMLHRFHNINSLLWRRYYDANTGIYCYSQYEEESQQTYTGEEDEENSELFNI